MGSRFTSDAVANSIFGVDGKGLSGEYSEILEKGSTIFNTSTSLIIYFAVAQLFPGIERFWKKSMVSNSVERFFEDLTHQAVQMRADEKHQIREDFLSYLIQLQQKKQLSHIDMTAHAMTFFLDGFETSSLVIANTLHHLARNSEIQKKLRSEIEMAIGPKDTISYEEIMDLTYLEQIIYGKLKLILISRYN